MASKITSNDFTASLTDNVELVERTYGNTTDYVVTNCTAADQRVVRVLLQAAAGAGTYTTLFNYDATLNEAGQGIQGEYVYFRITNLDDVNDILLQVITTAATSCLQLKLGPQQSFMLQDMDINVRTTAMPATGYPTYDKIAQIRAAAIDADIDVEIMTVFNPVAI